jgi:gliding motility-associated-like protein
MKRKTSNLFNRRIFILFFLLSGNTFCQTVSTCTNSDFELGNFSNWNGEIGSCCPIFTSPSGIINGRHTIMTGGVDPYSLGLVPRVFPGGSYSARLGNDHVNSEAEKLTYTFDVTDQTDLFIYRYAVILEDPNHDPSEQPRFQISVQDQNGQPIGCGTYNVVSGANIPGFQNNGDYRFKTWTTIGIDLSSYIGQTVTIIFATGDCSLGGHFGYAYLDCYCSPLQISSDMCPESNVVNLTAPVGFASYLWSDGQTSSAITINNPVLGSNYSVTMTSVTGCTVTLSTLIAPTFTSANFIPASLCRNDVVLVDSSYTSGGYPITGWIWDFGDGQTSTQQNPFHSYPASGNYDVSLIATSSIGCHDTLLKTIYVMPVPDAEFTFSNICNGSFLHLTDQSTITSGSVNQWEWDFGDSASVETTHNPIHGYPIAGNYIVTLIATGSNNCVDTISHPLDVYPSPTASFSVGDICLNSPASFIDHSVANAGNVASWHWDFGDNSFDNSQYPSHIFHSDGTQQVSLIIISDNGCTDTVENTLTVHPLPNPQFTISDACAGDSTTFTNLSTISSGSVHFWQWDFGDGSLFSTDQQPRHLYPSTGIYQATLTAVSDFSCSYSLMRNAKVHEFPQADFTVDRRAGCEPLSVSFTDLSNSTDGQINSWYWNFGDATPVNHFGNPDHIYNDDGVYNVTLISGTQFGCRDTIKKNEYILVYPRPEAGFSVQPEEVTMINPTVTLFDAYTDATNWTYSFGDGSISESNNPQHLYSAPGNYEVKQIVWNQFQCYDTLKKKVHVEDDYAFYIPNSFTPNGDGENDFFYGTGFRIFSFKMSIYNRWGDLIYETNDIGKPWDGRFNGNPAQSDVYIYKITTTDVFHLQHEYIGDVTLVR